MRGLPWSKSDARLLKWAKRGTFVSLFGYACLMAGMILASGCASNAPVSAPVVPVRAIDSKWQEDNTQKATACEWAARELSGDAEEIKIMVNFCMIETGVMI